MERKEWEESLLSGSEGETANAGAEENKEAEVDYSRAAGVKEKIQPDKEDRPKDEKEGSGVLKDSSVPRTSFAWSSSSNSYGNNYAGGGNGAYRKQGISDQESGIYNRQSDEYQNMGNSAESDDSQEMKSESRAESMDGGIGSAESENGGFSQNDFQQGTGVGTKRQKKQKKPMSRRAKTGIAAVLVIVLAFGAGFGGGAAAFGIYRHSGSGTSGGTNSNISIDSSESGMDAASVIAEKVMPSVVGISTVSQTYTQSIFGLQQGTVEGSGTGFIVDEDGYILTNAHVVESSSGSSSITVDLYDGSEYEGTVLWSDTTLDLAIVKIDATNLQAVDLGDSDDVKIGDYAVAIGNPLGRNFERSVTQGIISGLDRSITTADSNGQNQNNMQGLIQTDASINSGNSGGPLINSSGEVIGINTAKASSAEGLGFAIPINTALPIIEEIKENGTYEQVYLGISGLNVEDAIAQYQTDFKATEGVVVMQIYTDSPALAAGMKEGDIITAIDGDKIDDMSELKKKLVSYKPGDKITVSIERNKTDQTLELTLEAQSTASSTAYNNSISGSSGTDGSSGSQPDGNGSSGGQNYGGLFGGIFGN